MTASALDSLEESIQKAIAQIRRLERDNERLRDKAEKLEKRLEELPREIDSSSWDKERRQIRARVEKLAEHLEGVLED